MTIITADVPFAGATVNGVPVQSGTPRDIYFAGYGQSLSLGMTHVEEQLVFMNAPDNWSHFKHGRGGTDIRKLYPAANGGLGNYEDMLAGIALESPDLVVLDWIHGSANRRAERADYLQWLNNLYTFLKRDIDPRLVFGLDQISSMAADQSEVPAPALAQWDFAEQHANAFLVGAKYGHRPDYQVDYVHLTADGYRHLGNQHAKAWYIHQYSGGWEPLQPEDVTYDGNVTITVNFHVPAPPMVIDEMTLPTHPNGCYGFEVFDSVANCQSVTINPDSVTLTLDQPIASTDAEVGYAITRADAIGSYGNIKDSDNTPLESGRDAANWMIHWRLPIPGTTPLSVTLKSIKVGR